MGTAAELASLIRGRGPAVVLTGAGMSTESGIPDFRSASGIWAEVDPFEVASIDAFRRDPLRVWRWYGPRIAGLLAAEPNAGHVALAALERAGHVRAVVTQNIDLLHTRAGSTGRRRGARLDRALPVPRVRREEPLDAVLAQLETREAPALRAAAARSSSRVSSCSASCSPSRAMERAERARARGGPAPRRRVVAPGLARRGAARGHASVRAARSRSSTSRRRRTTRTRTIVVRGPVGAGAGGGRTCARCDGGERVV